MCSFLIPMKNAIFEFSCELFAFPGRALPRFISILPKCKKLDFIDSTGRYRHWEGRRSTKDFYLNGLIFAIEDDLNLFFFLRGQRLWPCICPTGWPPGVTNLDSPSPGVEHHMEKPFFTSDTMELESRLCVSQLSLSHILPTLVTG